MLGKATCHRDCAKEGQEGGTGKAGLVCSLSMQEAEAGGSLALTLTEIRGEKYKEECQWWDGFRKSETFLKPG